MVLLLKVKTQSKLLSTDTAAGTADDALCRPRASACVWVLRMCTWLFPGLCAQLYSKHARLRVHVIPWMTCFPGSASPWRSEDVGGPCFSFSLWKSLHTGSPQSDCCRALCFWEAPEVRYRQGRGVVHVVNNTSHHFFFKRLSPFTALVKDGYYKRVSKFAL